MSVVSAKVVEKYWNLERSAEAEVASSVSGASELARVVIMITNSFVLSVDHHKGTLADVTFVSSSEVFLINRCHYHSPRIEEKACA